MVLPGGPTGHGITFPQIGCLQGREDELLVVHAARRTFGGDEAIDRAGVEAAVAERGRAMITGKWADVGKFKGPILRALAARAPYFHNGFAATLDEVIEFYDTRFNIGLTAREKADLVAFLRAL